MRRRRLKSLLVLGALIGSAVGCLVWFRKELQPLAQGEPIYIRFGTRLRLKDALTQLKEHGIIRDRLAMEIYAWFRRGPGSVARGTYLVRPGDAPSTILAALEKPIRQMVRMPETNWARRNARLLENHQVTSAGEYLADVADPSRFSRDVDFPLPGGTLEGYLYPDTYDFPPLLGADAVVTQQLDEFQTQVWEPIGKPPNLDRIVTKASLVELEAGTDEDRAMIAGVIDNRLNKGIPLEIDAAIMYALGKWRRLYNRDYKEIKSPYNLYLHKGLPPTPICSPSLKSIVAVMHPVKHNYLFYVALPGGASLFAKTYSEHLQNVAIRRDVLNVLSFFQK